MSGINPYEMQMDARTWNTYWERVVATVTVDVILKKVFQGKKDGLRDQMLDVAAKECRRIVWATMEDLDEETRQVLIDKAVEILDGRE